MSRARPALGAAALWSSHLHSEGATPTIARSVVVRREADPSSGLASRIGFPAPSYEPHRLPADEARWGLGRMSRRGAPRLGGDEPREDDDPLGRRVQRMAR